MLIAFTDARWIVHKVHTSIGLSEVVEAEANEGEQSNQLVETKEYVVSTVQHHVRLNIFENLCHRKLDDFSIQFRHVAKGVMALHCTDS